MYVIRCFEERLLELFSEGRLSGTTHTCIGQEANAVGIAHNLTLSDVVFSNHRCHGHYLALTGDLKGLMSEVMGKQAGVCGGRGGSQHLHAGNFYTNGIQGGIVPAATGAALAAKFAGGDSITVVFIGDGTLGQGVIYECMNIASLWSLPLLIVLENNQYAQTTPVSAAVSGGIAARATAFGIESIECSTTDVEIIINEAAQAIDMVRRRRKPFFLVINTYRLGPHSKGDDHRCPNEIAERRREDPLLVAGSRISPQQRVDIEARCRGIVQEVAATAGAEEDAS